MFHRGNRNFALAMWIIIFTSILVGFTLGWTFRRRLPAMGWLSTPLVWLLLFLLGTETGGNDRVMSALPELGGTAVLVALATAIGSALMAALLGGWIRRRKEGSSEG